MPTFATYEAATRCTSGAGAGARALMSALLGASPGLSNWGIFNCRNTALGNKSAHGEGRALDIGCNVATGKKLVALLFKVGPSRLGISVIIHNRVIYSAKSPNGRRYTGVPHTDHVHVEMTRSAAKSLTLSAIRAVLGGGAVSSPPATNPPAGKKLPVLSKGDEHELVPVLKRFFGLDDSDDVFGSALDAKVRDYQEDQGLLVDGYVGLKTWGRILVDLNLPGWAR